MTEPDGTREVRIAVADAGTVSGLLLRPPDAAALLVFAHGAGAGMRHEFMRTVAGALARRGVATLRYHFPYMERGGGPPDRRPVLVETVRAAMTRAADVADGLPIVAGGKSMGGRMTSTAVAGAAESRGETPEATPGADVRGLVFFGFPLHPAGKPSTGRADHLADVGLPMLFLQGTRDRLAELDLLRPVLDGLRRSPTLHVVEDADHGFRVLKRTGRSDAEVIDELADVTAAWIGDLG